MPLEVEQKYRSDDLDALAGKIRAAGGKGQARVRQVDLYFAHPSRDFRETDEALRLRRVGETNRVTYKGQSSTRRPRPAARSNFRSLAGILVTRGGQNC